MSFFKLVSRCHLWVLLLIQPGSLVDVGDDDTGAEQVQRENWCDTSEINKSMQNPHIPSVWFLFPKKK